MLSYEEAVVLVERAMAKLEPLPPEDEWIIYAKRTIERDFGWVFFLGSKLYEKTGEIQYAVAGNAPIIVNRTSGTIFAAGTAEPISFYLAEYESHLNGQRA